MHPLPTTDPNPEGHSHGAGTPENLGRRGMLLWVGGALGAVAGALLTIPVVGYLVGILARPRPQKWVRLGLASDFELGKTRLALFVNPLRASWDGESGKTGVYVRNLGEENGKAKFMVKAMNCTHLGCPVSWFEQSGLFMCPCHGGVYYENGERASGPPPRGLYDVPYRITTDGQLEVQAPHLPTLQDPLTRSSGCKERHA